MSSNHLRSRLSAIRQVTIPVKNLRRATKSVVTIDHVGDYADWSLTSFHTLLLENELADARFM
jgi:hypothetical protein